MRVPAPSDALGATAGCPRGVDGTRDVVDVGLRQLEPPAIRIVETPPGPGERAVESSRNHRALPLHVRDHCQLFRKRVAITGGDSEHETAASGLGLVRHRSPGGAPSTGLRRTALRLQRPRPRSGAGRGSPAHSLRGSQAQGSSHRRRSGGESAPAP